MKYRQWKKNYKKMHGVNPPLELDKRKQRRLAKKAAKTISRADFTAVATNVAEVIINATADFMRVLGGAFDTVGTVCRNVADNVQPIGKGRAFIWQAREYGVGNYAVYRINTLDGTDEPRVVTHTKKAAEKIAEIMKSDYIECIRRTRPENIKCRNDAVCSRQPAIGNGKMEGQQL